MYKRQHTICNKCANFHCHITKGASPNLNILSSFIFSHLLVRYFAIWKCSLLRTTKISAVRYSSPLTVYNTLLIPYCCNYIRWFHYISCIVKTKLCPYKVIPRIMPWLNILLLNVAGAHGIS